MINGPCSHGQLEAYACWRCILAGLNAEVQEDKARTRQYLAEQWAGFARFAKETGTPNESVAAQVVPLKGGARKRPRHWLPYGAAAVDAKEGATGEPEITSDMLDAGVRAFFDNSPNFNELDEMVKAIFLAMISARDADPTNQHKDDNDRE